MATRLQRSLTYEDYVLFPDDGRRWELIDGEAFVVPAPSLGHQDMLLRLARLIADYLDEHGGGQVFIAPCDVVFAPSQVFQPDVIFVSDDDSSVLTDKNIQGAPTWLIEVVSDSVRDKRVKREIYARYGVREYWTIDPELRNVEIHRLGEESVVMAPPEKPESRSLRGLFVDLEEVFGPDLRPRRI